MQFFISIAINHYHHVHTATNAYNYNYNSSLQNATITAPNFRSSDVTLQTDGRSLRAFQALSRGRVSMVMSTPFTRLVNAMIDWRSLICVCMLGSEPGTDTNVVGYSLVPLMYVLSRSLTVQISGLGV